MDVTAYDFFWFHVLCVSVHWSILFSCSESQAIKRGGRQKDRISTHKNTITHYTYLCRAHGVNDRSHVGMKIFQEAESPPTPHPTERRRSAQICGTFTRSRTQFEQSFIIRTRTDVGHPVVHSASSSSSSSSGGLSIGTDAHAQTSQFGVPFE